MGLRYRCLVLDHDDTVADSTRHIHWPAYQDAMAELRPDMPVLSLQEYFRINFAPGFMPYLEQVLHLTPEEEAREYQIWQARAGHQVPDFFPGIPALIRGQLAAGGVVCVVSHSVADNIRRDYRTHGLPEPTLVYGWEQPKDRRKPSPWPLQEIMRQLSLQPKDLLVVDDLKPGLDMAQAAGVDFAAACWAYDVPEIRNWMAAHSPHCFDTPEALAAWLLAGE